MNADPLIYILLPVHNRRITTEKFIHCLLQQTYRRWHLVLIDDGSGDGTESMARELAPSLTVLRGKGDWWWGGALHQGYQWLKSHATAEDLALIINDDTEFGHDFLSNAVRAVKPHSLLLAQLHDSNGTLLETGVRWDWSALHCAAVTDDQSINCFSTRGLFLYVSSFLEIGGFHPVLLPHYLSDYEFTMRAYRKGFALITAPDVFLRYDETLTGIRTTEGLSVLRGLRTNLSIRSTANPVYWTSFVLLTSSMRYLPVNLFRVWWRFLGPVRDEIRLFFAPVRRLFAPIRHFLGRVKRKIKREWAARTGATR